MRYLVTLETIDDGQLLPPPEQAAYLENVVIPAIKALNEWEGAGKIRGGTLAGRRGVAFVAEAASHEELGSMLRQLPVWGIAEVEITPLESFGHMESELAEAVRMMRSM